MTTYTPIEFPSIADLCNSEKFHAALDVSGFEVKALESFLRSMLLIRSVERKLADNKRDGLIGGPVHLGAGQEAIAVAVSACLNSSDCVFSAHRSHAHLLALGGSVFGLFAEVLGRATGLSKGRGGSMHLWEKSCGFYGSVPIVAGTVPLAVGAGLALKLKRSNAIAVAYFGDGAVEEGVVHESMNLARIHNLPVIFIVENNLFASHLHISLRQPVASVARFASANDIPHVTLDGNDVLGLYRASKNFVERARNGGGPSFLEAVTFRFYGHVDWREDIDVGVARTQSDLANWRLRDPILRLSKGMQEAGAWRSSNFDDMLAEVQNEVDGAWENALRQPPPLLESLMNDVYAGGNHN